MYVVCYALRGPDLVINCILFYTITLKNNRGWYHLGMDSRSSHCVPVLIKHKVFTSRAPDKAELKPGEGCTGCTCISTEEYIRTEDSVRIILALQIEYCKTFELLSQELPLGVLESETRSLGTAVWIFDFKWGCTCTQYPCPPPPPLPRCSPSWSPGNFCLRVCKGSVWKNMHIILQYMP